MVSTRNLRVKGMVPLLSPADLMAEIPLSSVGEQTVAEGRRDVAEVLGGGDDRLVVVVGPCSIHDPVAAIDYAKRLLCLREQLKDALCIVMRVYFEKPRTTLGWKGLINDPHLDGTFAIDKGLHTARRLLADLADMGMPTAVEFLDPISPQYIAGLISWGAIGARTTESQVHREMASGLSMPIGFKNGTYGTVQIAVDAVVSARGQHRFLGVDDDGKAGIIQTTGNANGHVILRGGTSGPNYDAASVADACGLLTKAGLYPRLMVDCSHGNSLKDFNRQPEVARDVAARIAVGDKGVFGIMIESFIEEGRQNLVRPGDLRYGQSITDACIGWATTASLLPELAEAVRCGRKR